MLSSSTVGLSVLWLGRLRAIICRISCTLEPGEGQADRKKLDAVLYHLAESLRIIAIWISPVLPKAAHGIFDQFNWKMELSAEKKNVSRLQTRSGAVYRMGTWLGNRPIVPAH